MRLLVPPEDEGARLDAFLSGHLGSRTRAQRLIAAGNVLVDGGAAPKRHRVRAGETIDVDEADEREPIDPGEGDPAPHEVVWEDEHLLVVDKPPGVVVHPAPGHRGGTLAQALAGRAAGGDAERPGIVHRLDRDTSGLLVVAKSDAVLRALQVQLGAREIEREYAALVEGRPPALSGTIDAPLGRDRKVRTRRSSDTDDPRPAVTHFEIAEALPSTTLLRVQPGDRPHPPDPRAPARDRASGGGRSGVRDRRPAGARAAVPARRAPGVHAPGHGRADRGQDPSCRTTFVAL